MVREEDGEVKASMFFLYYSSFFLLVFLLAFLFFVPFVSFVESYELGT